MLLTTPKAQQLLAEHVKARRLSMGLTQEGLAVRSGVALPTLRKFEQKGLISLESFLKLLHVLNVLDGIVEATAPVRNKFNSIEDVLKEEKTTTPKKGWRK